MNFWLLKSEPSEFSIQDLKKKRKEMWNGVRNFQARNFIRGMKVGDKAFLYHSSCEMIGIAGLMEVVSAAYPDPSQFDKSSEYFDPKSKKDSPLWFAVDVGFVKEFSKVFSLEEIKADPFLKDMLVTKKGSRLSVRPVEKKHFEYICSKVKS